jgi:hypothetical protein
LRPPGGSPRLGIMQIPQTIGPVDVTKREFVAMSVRQSLAVYARTMLLALVIFLPLELSHLNTSEASQKAASTISFMVALFALVTLVSVFRVRKFYAVAEEAFRGVQWGLAEENLELVNSRSTSHFSWGEFSKCYRQGKAVILKHRAGTRFFMPARAFASDAEAFEAIEWMRARIVNSRQSRA